VPGGGEERRRAGVGVPRTAVPSTGPLYRLMLLSPEQTAEIAKTKQVIYDGFKAAVPGGVPRDRAGILVDEQFGAAILEFDELVPGSRSEMIDLLSGARAGNSVGAISYVTNSLWHHLPSAQRAALDVRAKVGFMGPNTHTDAAIVKHASAAGDVRYTVAILNAADPNTAEAAARALDITLVTSHQPSPSP
jgi:hypothetical protein